MMSFMNIFIFQRCLCVFSVQDSTSSADVQLTAQDVQTLVREATLLLKEPLEAMAGPLRTYRKRLQVETHRIPLLYEHKLLQMG